MPLVQERYRDPWIHSRARHRYLHDRTIGLQHHEWPLLGHKYRPSRSYRLEMYDRRSYEVLIVAIKCMPTIVPIFLVLGCESACGPPSHLYRFSKRLSRLDLLPTIGYISNLNRRNGCQNEHSVCQWKFNGS